MPALVYAGIGDADKAIDLLERAYGEKSYYMAALGTFPLFDGLQAHPRFKSLLKRVGIPARLNGTSPPA
jgi:hypothetical protein